MIHSFRHHGACQRPKLIFLEGLQAPAVAQKPEVKKQVERRPQDHEMQWLGQMEMEHGEATFRAELAADMRAMGLNNPSLIEAGVTRYMQRYRQIMAELHQKVDEKKRDFKKAERNIKDSKDKEKKALKENVRDFAQLSKLNQEKLPDPKEERAMEQYFGKWVNTVGEYYFNKNLSTGIKVGYGDGVERLKNHIQVHVQAELNELQTNQADMKAYENLRTEILNRYARYASFDGDPSSISSIDLTILDKRMEWRLDQMDAMIGLSDQELIERMEDYSLLHPEEWQRRTFDLGRSVIKTARKSGLKNEFIQAVNRQMATKEPVENFAQAKQAFLEKLGRISKLGAKETSTFLAQFNAEVFKITATPEAEVTQKNNTLKVQIGRQMDYLRDGVLIPNTSDDKTLVEYVNAKPRQRKLILANPKRKQELLRAIKKTTELYPLQLQDSPDRVQDSTTNSSDITKETDDDLAGRHRAMIIYGEQGKALLGKDNATILTELEQLPTPDLETASDPDLDFKQAKTLTQPAYISALERGGFNGTNLALKTAKCLGVLLVVSNVIQVARNSQGKNWVEKLGNGIQDTITSPHTAFAAGVTVFAHKADNDPRLLKYFTAGKNDWARIEASRNLEQVASKTSIEHRNKFVNDMAEWQVIRRIKNKGQFETLMNAAQEQQKGTNKHYITPDMLAEAGVIEKNSALYRRLDLPPRVNRTRYLMYESFFSSPEADPYKVKENCTGSSYIEEE